MKCNLSSDLGGRLSHELRIMYGLIKSCIKLFILKTFSSELNCFKVCVSVPNHELNRISLSDNLGMASSIDSIIRNAD